MGRGRTSLDLKNKVHEAIVFACADADQAHAAAVAMTNQSGTNGDAAAERVAARVAGAVRDLFNADHHTED